MEDNFDLPPLTPAPQSGHVSGNETTFCFTDNDAFQSEAEIPVTSSGW